MFRLEGLAAASGSVFGGQDLDQNLGPTRPALAAAQDDALRPGSRGPNEILTPNLVRLDPSSGAGSAPEGDLTGRAAGSGREDLREIPGVGFRPATKSTLDGSGADDALAGHPCRAGG